MRTSGILESLFIIHKVNGKQASHLAIKSNGKIRYLVDLRKGVSPLCTNVSTYSNKLKILMMGLKFLPLQIFPSLKLGDMVKVDILPSVHNYLKKIDCGGWNVIVGTYDEKQKVVLQCYDNNLENTVYVKIGNEMSKIEMGTEIQFLRENPIFQNFQIPQLETTFSDQENHIQVQVTKEFVGDRVETNINERIVSIYQEIAAYHKDLNNEKLEFSHGDFAPWNVKIRNGLYTVFDWEHCGYRVKGFDLLHYAIMPKLKLEGQDLDASIKKALTEIRNYIPDFQIDIDEFKVELNKIHLERS